MIVRGVAGAIWLSTCLLGAYTAMRYEFQPGRLGPSQAAWPGAVAAGGEAALADAPTAPTVMAFLHPRCVCTRATVKLLVEALRDHPEAALTVALFVPDDGAGAAGWKGSEHLAVIRAARPGTRVIWDRGGAQARRFGALTSGTILVYDAQAREVFRGGITGRRGGEEANAGLERMTRALAGEPAGPEVASPVFGCSLIAPDAPPGGSGP